MACPTCVSCSSYFAICSFLQANFQACWHILPAHALLPASTEKLLESLVCFVLMAAPVPADCQACKTELVVTGCH